MKITAVKLSVFELPTNTARFDLEQVPYGHRTRWQSRPHSRSETPIHVLHVLTDEGLEGICTVGDARYQTMRRTELEQLRIMTIGQDPLDRERLDDKLRFATRSMFSQPGWHGTFDNCLWDIAGQAADLPVCALIGRSRPRCKAYYNFASGSLESAVEGCDRALAAGFAALKDHWHGTPETNIAWSQAVRAHVGPAVELLHDAAGSPYTLREALRVGHALAELEYGWFEEAISDRDLQGLQTLCAELAIPVMALETLMHDYELCAAWIRAGATDLIRANARHGTTATLKLAHLAAAHRASIELNGPGGLFGLVHAHLVCALENTTYYEYFPGGSRDELGREIGLTNPPMPVDGHITPPETPGWGAEWDRAYFAKKRVAEW
ncbi:MAG: enolase C-terminal domain-like protein [Candidatus Latescibacterota bacterium]|nr:enolase C-terminal domain-like protein [Candidatus Latescibacterota bacterium]